MRPIDRLKSFHTIKLLADPRRLAILRLLMAGPSTLTQLGHSLGEHPAWVRHHLKLLEAAGLVGMTSTEDHGGYTEKYYAARASAFLLQELVLPDFGTEPVLVVQGSHDVGLDALAEAAQERYNLHVQLLPVGSLDGLVALRQGIAHLSGCHLLDFESGEYNRPYIRHLFPDQPMQIITLAHRTQGLIVASGNPRQIFNLEDISRPDILFINRNLGSGTRLWLDHSLAEQNLPAGQVLGYERFARTHSEVARLVEHGAADVGLGSAAAALQAGLDFIPLFEERYDLVYPLQGEHPPALESWLDFLNSRTCRQVLENIGGYMTHSTGTQVPLD